MDQRSNPIAWNEGHFDITWGELDRINERQEFSNHHRKLWGRVLSRFAKGRKTVLCGGLVLRLHDCMEVGCSRVQPDHLEVVVADKSLRPHASDGYVGRLMEGLYPWLQQTAKVTDLAVQHSIKLCLPATQEARARRNEPPRQSKSNCFKWSTEGFNWNS